MVNASPYGELYKADSVTLRDSPNDDIGNNTNPFLDNTYTTRLQKENTLFGTIYAKGDLPFGFSYQTNFTPNFGFTDISMPFQPNTDRIEPEEEWLQEQSKQPITGK